MRYLALPVEVDALDIVQLCLGVLERFLGPLVVLLRLLGGDFGVVDNATLRHEFPEPGVLELKGLVLRG